MRRRTLSSMVMVCILVLLAGCAGARMRSEEAPVQNSGTRADLAPAPAPPEAAVPSSTGELAGDSDRMIVSSASLSLIVTDTAAAQQSIRQAVSELGGYIADSSAWREGEQLRARMTLRVPAEKLDTLMAAVKALAVRVERENVSGEDVTEEYTDLRAQLTNLEATEQELRELLAEVRQRTQKAEDILQVYRELTSIRGEIERVQGRMQYLETMTDLATVDVELVPDVLAKPVVEPGWRPLETLRGAGRTLVNTMKGLLDVLIWFVIYVLPLLVVIAIPVTLVALIVCYVKRRIRSSGSAASK